MAQRGGWHRASVPCFTLYDITSTSESPAYFLTLLVLTAASPDARAERVPVSAALNPQLSPGQR